MDRLKVDEIKDNLITAVAALIINDSGYILGFARNGDENKLGLIAGGREAGETLNECIRREAREEAGLEDLEIPDRPLFIDKPGEAASNYCATFLVRYNGFGPFPLANEYEAGKSEGYAFWIRPEDLIRNDRAAFKKYNTQLLRRAKLID